MFKYILALYVIICSFSGFANKPSPLVSKSFIISFQKPSDALILNEVSQFRFTRFEALNVAKTIFKASYIPNILSESDAIQLINKLPNVQFVQEDGPVYLRNSLPNDTLISYQWHLNLIKATQAWDLTRGGLNRRGDTIVIAIVDDGLYINDPNFKDNIWINYADKDKNGKDDDGNGFIDDHYGWNFMGRNNDVSDSTNYNSKHGTSVAGIVGATGNNLTGICGILWKVKLMVVNIADTSSTAGSNFAFQSDVIRAYNYALYQRQLYNTSKGKKGAFVVGINSSWGIDGKFASQAPIWCAMYDSLGKAGILTAGATSNSNTDVEDSGDLPSTCTSNHLIVVSSVNKNDVNANRGYGTTSVDINAPGEGVYTTYAYTVFNQISGLYGGFSGTSAATPMVTGAIGLLNAYACEKLMDVIKSDPAKANLLIRSFILNGVDTLPSLVGKNVTTGRLNILKAMKMMDQYCYGASNQKNIRAMQKVIIFPNPGNGLLNIESFSELVKVQCFDITGKTMPCKMNENKLDISGLENGIYYFRIETIEGTSVIPYIKSN